MVNETTNPTAETCDNCQQPAEHILEAKWMRDTEPETVYVCDRCRSDWRSEWIIAEIEPSVCGECGKTELQGHHEDCPRYRER